MPRPFRSKPKARKNAAYHKRRRIIELGIKANKSGRTQCPFPAASYEARLWWKGFRGK